MKLTATKAWVITYDEVQSLITKDKGPVTVTTDYGITLSGEVHNIQNACLKLHIGNCSFAAIQFSDIRRLEVGDVVIETNKEADND